MNWRESGRSPRRKTFGWRTVRAKGSSFEAELFGFKGPEVNPSKMFSRSHRLGQMPLAIETSSPSYYRARYYDPAVGRFLAEDPIGADGGIDFYTYVGNSPTTLADPLGLYGTAQDVPKPLPPRLDQFMQCMDNCTGQPQFVTGTTNGKHTDPGHAAGTTVDLRPIGTPSDKLFCCAGKCGAVFGLDERKIKTKNGTGLHFHLQLEWSIVPNAPNSIPNRPECKPGSKCSQ